MKKVTEKAEELSQNESVAGEKRFLFNLNREKIEKMILYTAMILALNHTLITVWVSIYNIGVPSARGIDGICIGFLIAEILLLFIYIGMTEKEIKKNIYEVIKHYFTKDQILISAIPLFYYISLVYSAATEGIISPEDNFKHFFDCLVGVFIIYPVGRSLFKHKLPRVFEIVLHIVILGITCYIVYILYNVFKGQVITTHFRGKIGVFPLDKGDYIEYHLQINSHHNTTGAYAALFTLISISMAAWKKGLLRIVYLIAACCHGVVLVLSNSRSTFLSGCVFIAILIGLIAFFAIKHKWINKKVLRWLLTIFVIIGSFGCLIALRESVFWIYEECANVEVVKESDVNENHNIDHQDEVLEENISRNLDVTNLMGREIIWGAAVTGIVANKRNFLIGVTPCGVGEVICEMSNGLFTEYAHNQILEIGVSLGVPAMLIFILWLVLLANRCVMLGFADEKRVSLQQKCIPLLVLFCAMFNMFEATLFFYNTFTNGIFMLVSAWCYEAARFGRVAEEKRFMGIFMKRKEIETTDI